MTVAYFDCFAGAAGDMIVGALIDAGADVDALGRELAKLSVDGATTSAKPAQRGGIGGTWFRVMPAERDQPHRHLSGIIEMIDKAQLPTRAAKRAKAAFTRLAEAEAAIHGTDIENVHFHEVGAIDSIVDIVGACVALELLGVDTIVCSSVPVGSGTIRCDHGVMPAPAPATARMLATAGAPTRALDVDGEVTTPTAAALLTTLADTFGPLPAMTVSAVGYGAGSREGGPLPNLLRVFIGRGGELGTADTVVELAANLDDCTGELIGATIDRLLSAGCLDAWATPAVTKKSRPAWTLSALCHPGDVDAAEAIMLTETTTFGVRRRLCQRTMLTRRHETVETQFGPIRVKIGSRGGSVLTASPEFEDCRSAADAHHAAVKDVLAAAQAAYAQARSGPAK
ncbi:MAG: nickel pincer cofactor biosynthesis protein LarC [Planctomycetota bacterium]